MSDRFTRRALGGAALGACMGGMSLATPGRDSATPRRELRWRSDFPALAQSVGDQPLTYLDSAATTQRPTAVIDAITAFYQHDNANPGAALHTLARRAHGRYEDARRTVAQFINAREPEEVVWTRGTTEAINLVATAWAESELQRGDEILLTIAEHASNLLPWRIAAQRIGARVSYVDVDEAGRIRLDDLERKLSARTRLVAFSHVSNVTGYINPAAEICTRARAAGARVLIDAAQSAPHISLDVQALGCDFCAFSSHKMLGPMGIGVLWTRRELLDRMRPYQAGSNMAHDVDTESEHLESGARRFGAGTPNVCGPVGLSAAIQYLRTLGSAVQLHEQALVDRGLAVLTAIPGLRLLGPETPENRLPVFSFTLTNHAPGEVLRHLDARGIAVRAGDLAALPLLKHFGAQAAVRASAYLYTGLDELDRLAEALRSLAPRTLK